MSDRCETVSAVLGLYAEGELQDPRTVELVREHLLDCAACREALEVYDSLTRTILAGEPERLSSDAVGWVELERERRAEGVLRRLDRFVPAAIPENEANGARSPEVLLSSSDEDEPEAAHPERTSASRLRLRLDDPAPLSSRSARFRAGAGRYALAAAVLVGIAVWLAAVLSGLLPTTPRRLLSGLFTDEARVLRDATRSSAALAVVSSGPERSAWPRRPSDRPLGWVVRDAFDDRFPLPPSRSGPGGTDLLLGVDYPGHPASWSSMAAASAPPHDAEIQWIVQFVVVDAPPGHGETLSEPRYFLRPVASGLEGSPTSDRWLDSGGAWIRPGWVESRPARGGDARRVTIGDSIIYQVCVYEGLRRLELPARDWTPVGWQQAPAVFGERQRVAPHVPFAWRPDLSREVSPRF